jgi:hypothetical protein
MPDRSIEPARLDDAAAIVELQRLCFQAEAIQYQRRADR